MIDQNSQITRSCLVSRIIWIIVYLIVALQGGDGRPAWVIPDRIGHPQFLSLGIHTLDKGIWIIVGHEIGQHEGRYI